MKFKRNLYITIAVTAALYLAWCFWAGWNDVLTALSKFHWWIFPICLGLAFSNYCIRFLKWHYYLHILSIPLSTKLSFQVFLSGLVMSATPGKFGEVFKSYLVKEIQGTLLSRSAPIILAERLTDFIAFLILALFGVRLLPFGHIVFPVSIGIVIGFLLIVSWKSAIEWIIDRIHAFPMIGSHTEKIRMMYESMYQLISPAPFVWAIVISLISWFLECLAFALVLWGFGVPLPLLSATFIYAFGTIMGALLMTPGGIGPTEGTIGSFLILLYKVPPEIATSATLIIRICTLWFAVVVGLVTLTCCAHGFSAKPDMSDELDAALNDIEIK